MLRVKNEATAGKSSYSYEGLGSGRFKVDGREYTVDDPKGGSVAS